MACDESLSVVKRSRAKAQVAILKNDNGQSLRTMRITQGACARKMAKAATKARGRLEGRSVEARGRAGRSISVGGGRGRRRRRPVHHTAARGGQGRLRRGRLRGRDLLVVGPRVPSGVDEVHGPEAKVARARGSDGVAAQVSRFLRCSARVFLCGAAHGRRPLPLS